MSQFLAIAKIILSLFPLVIQAVQALEAAFPQSGQGAVKLGLVKTTLESAYSIASDAEVEFEKIWPVLEKAIAGLVTFAKSLKG